jgi:hypothetical protein
MKRKPSNRQVVGRRVEPLVRKRLYEFTSLVRVAIVVAADSAGEAEAAVKDLSIDGLMMHSDRLEIVEDGMDLMDERECKSNDLHDEAHLVV